MSSRRHLLRLAVALAVGLLPSCGERQIASDEHTRASCDAASVRQVVERFGSALKEVSLQAPDAVAQIRQTYAPFVTPDLLERWTAEPATAPGREVSSPWPARIDVRSVSADGETACVVEGEVVYLTSVERTQGGAAMRQPVTLRVVRDGDWRIGAYEARAPASPGVEAPAPDVEPPSPGPDVTVPDAVSPPAGEDPTDVIRRYYAAIDERDFRRAYELWGDGGAASGQSYEAFAQGFEETASVEVEIGEPGPIGAAAGSRYVEIPVVIRANTVDGEDQRFEGSYTLRRSVVDGATAEQRRWRIYSADVHRSSRPGALDPTPVEHVTATHREKQPREAARSGTISSPATKPAAPTACAGSTSSWPRAATSVVRSSRPRGAGGRGEGVRGGAGGAGVLPRLPGRVAGAGGGRAGLSIACPPRLGRGG